MRNAGRYKFSDPQLGQLDLIIKDSGRRHYSPNEDVTYHFRQTGLTNEDQSCERFHLFEWQPIEYAFVAEENDTLNPPFRLLINGRLEKESGSSLKKVHFLSGQFAFKDVVGETRIEIIDAANRPLFLLETEVFPQKMDYKSDYQAMMAQITDIIHNLAYDVLKDTYKRSKARLTGTSTESEWWSILDALFENLIIQLGVIKRQPKHEIRTREKVLPVEQVKNSSKRNIAWMSKNGKFANKQGPGIEASSGNFYTHALSFKKYVTYDTYENRFVKWAIQQMIERLRRYRKDMMTKSKSDAHEAFFNRIKSYQSRLQGILHEDPFSETGTFEKRTVFSTTLTRGSGYRDFMYIHLLLTRGLEIADNNIFKIEQKNISTLYEYWCFLMLVKILRENCIHQFEYQDLIKIKAGKILVELEVGKASEITFKKTELEESITVYFNRKYQKDKQVFTYEQKPDYSIKFHKKGFDQPFWYLFDAKYRFEENAENDDNKFNVPQDAIGQLHRYRDAILHTLPSDNSSYKRAIKNLGGIILYPYPLSEDKFKETVFYKSIDQVNIGALPFLPGKTKLVSDLLHTTVHQRLPEEHFERFIDMDSSEYVKQIEDWNSWVTIGVIPSDNQNARLNFFKSTKVHYVQYVKDIDSKLFLTKEVLVCIAQTQEAFRCRVKSWEICSNKDLEKLGTKWLHHGDKYILFHLDDFQPVQTPHKIAPINFRYATVAGLNLYMKDAKSNTLAFYLTNPSAARLYRYLMQKRINFQLDWIKTNPLDLSMIEFNINGQKVLSSAKFGDLQFKADQVTLKYGEVVEKINQLVDSTSPSLSNQPN